MRFYDLHAERLFDEYEAIAFEVAHACFEDHLPKKPGMVLDVGAGSGRDAAWFAQRGHQVFAVEPAAGLRDRAASHHEHPGILWIDDRMPELHRIRSSGASFDTVWVSAVWMHLAGHQRGRAGSRARMRPPSIRCAGSPASRRRQLGSHGLSVAGRRQRRIPRPAQHHPERRQGIDVQVRAAASTRANRQRKQRSGGGL